MDKTNFLSELLSMTPEEIDNTIKSNGKGPKTIQLICRIESNGVENNTDTTQM